MHTHWSQFVPNMSTRHPRTLSSSLSSSVETKLLCSSGADPPDSNLCAWRLCCFHNRISTRNLLEDADSVVGQICGDNVCPFSGVTCSYVPLQWRVMQLCAPSVAYHAVMCPFSGVSCSYVPLQWRNIQLCAPSVVYHAVMCSVSGVTCSYVPLQGRNMQLWHTT